MNPREWDNLGTMLCYHRRYALGDQTGLPMVNAILIESRSEVDGEAALVLPLYLYDHGGLSISTEPFSCPFDSGKIGIIYATYNAIRKEYGKKRISKKILAAARERLVAEVAEYNAYLHGDEAEAE